MAKVYGVLPALGTLPATPTGLGLLDSPTAITAQSVAVEWDFATDATHWTIYFSGIPYGPLLEPFALISDLDPSTLYNIQVQAHNATGSSPLSEIFEATTSANTVPEWTLTDQAFTVGVAVNVNFGTFCVDIDNHPITYSIVSGSVPGVSINSNQNGLTGSPTTAGTYSLTIRANDGFGFSDVTIDCVVAAVADTTAPSLPTNLSVSVSGSSATFDWTPSTDASGIYTYRLRNGTAIVISLVGGEAYAESEPGAVAGPPVTLAGLANGTYDTYNLRVLDNSPARNTTVQTFFPQFTINVGAPAPDTPVYSPITVVSSTQLNHVWAAGGNGPAPTRYQLDRSTTGTDAQNPAAAGWTNVLDDSTVPLDLSFNNTGLSASTTYYYRLRAFNTTTPSAYATRNATTQAPPQFTFPTANRSGGPPWRHGISNPPSGAITAWQNWLGGGHLIDVFSAFTGEAGATTWSEFTQGGAPKFTQALNEVPNSVAIIHVWPLLAAQTLPGLVRGNHDYAHPEVWDAAANGDFYGYWHTAMQNMVLKCQNAPNGGRPLNTICFRLGHEMTGGHYPWSISSSKVPEFKEYWQECVGIIRTYFPGAIIAFEPHQKKAGNNQELSLASILPASSSYDTIGRSLHDVPTLGYVTSAATFNSSHVNPPAKYIGLQLIVDTCRSLNKKFTVSEWSTSMTVPVPNTSTATCEEPPPQGTQDIFFREVFNFFLANQDVMLWDTHFSTSCNLLYSAEKQSTAAAAMYKSKWHTLWV